MIKIMVRVNRAKNYRDIEVIIIQGYSIEGWYYVRTIDPKHVEKLGYNMTDEGILKYHKATY